MLEAKLKVMDTYLLVTISGDYDAGALKERMPGLVARADQEHMTRIFIDAMGVAPPDDDMKRFLLGEALAATVRPPLRVAVLSPAERINRFLENTAVNRGAMVFVTHDRQEAMQWLFPDKAQTGVSSMTC